MNLIKGSIDPRMTRIVEAMKGQDGLLLPKTAGKSEEKPLIVMETRMPTRFGCR